MSKQTKHTIGMVQYRTGRSFYIQTVLLLHTAALKPTNDL